jgi:hypothetical protein
MLPCARKKARSHVSIKNYNADVANYMFVYYTDCGRLFGCRFGFLAPRGES